MKPGIILLLSYLLISCNSEESNLSTQDMTSQNNSKPVLNDTIRQMFTANAEQITSIADSLIKANNKNQESNSAWGSTSTVFTEYAPNILGAIAARAGDSTECIVIEVTVFKNQKSHVMISAVDSSCSKKLNTINLKTDSTQTFLFGINKEPLY